MANTIEVKHATTAAEFWGLLSPEKPLFPQPSKLLYRGQGDDRWNLTPRLLRRGMSSTADFQVFKEWAYIEMFVRHCDSIGLTLPNDSPSFREQFLNQNSPKGPGGSVSEWPPADLHPLMALAQHYRLPTRLLDWSTRAYVAAYFAISDALERKISGSRNESDTDAERLAVWILDIEKRALFNELKVVTVPGGNNANLAAQSGRFTLLTQTGGRGIPFKGEIALDLYFASQSVPPPLKKVTLPIAEAPAALSLCSLYGVTGATLFPDYYGAARATEDALSTPPDKAISIWAWDLKRDGKAGQEKQGKAGQGKAGREKQDRRGKAGHGEKQDGKAGQEKQEKQDRKSRTRTGKAGQGKAGQGQGKAGQEKQGKAGKAGQGKAGQEKQDTGKAGKAGQEKQGKAGQTEKQDRKSRTGKAGQEKQDGKAGQEKQDKEKQDKEKQDRRK